MTDERDSRSSQPVPPILPNPPAAPAAGSRVRLGSQCSSVRNPRLSQQARKRRTRRQQLRRGHARLCACSIFAIVLFILSILIVHSRLSLAQFGWRFFTRRAWDPVSGDFGALPFIYGTLATSLLALLMAVPLALGVAIFLTELCPRPLRAPISFLTELLAAIPSVVYGLWAVFVLVPLMRDSRRPLPRQDSRLDWTSSPAQTSASVC